MIMIYLNVMGGSKRLFNILWSNGSSQGKSITELAKSTEF